MKSAKTTDRLRLGSEFAYVREHGIKYVCRYFLLVAAPSPDKEFRYGVICGRKFDKRAVVRNRARRLLKESVRLLKPRIKPCRMVLIPRRMILDINQPQVQENMEKLLARADLKQ
jgi:ribonuclease P protein component